VGNPVIKKKQKKTIPKIFNFKYKKNFKYIKKNNLKI